jgi:hypothetical protein
VPIHFGGVRCGDGGHRSVARRETNILRAIEGASGSGISRDRRIEEKSTEINSRHHHGEKDREAYCELDDGAATTGTNQVS